MGTPGEATPTETGAVGTPAAAAGDPKSTVEAFLTAVQQNPTGTDAQKYLSSYLSSRVDAGKTIPSLLACTTSGSLSPWPRRRAAAT